MEPVVMALKEKYNGKVEFIIADVDDPQGNSLAGKFQIDTIPAFKLIDASGKLVDSHVGYIKEGQIEEEINKLLK